MSAKPIQVEIDHERFRSSEVPLFSGSMGKLTKVTGWTPQIPFQKSLLDTIHFWRMRIQQEK